jgi:RES domain-containing protein
MVVCFRRADYATPLRAIAAAQPGRWHDAAAASPTQYLCLHPLGPLAELMRSQDLRTPEQVLAVRTRTWAIDVPLAGLLEITFGNAREHGISADDLVADDHTACRRLAAELRPRHAGLIVPSAALPGTRTVVLFGARVAAPFLTTPVSALDLPASITAHGGRPLLSLLEQACFRGSEHAALAAWREHRPFPFVEPSWSLPETA